MRVFQKNLGVLILAVYLVTAQSTAQGDPTVPGAINIQALVRDSNDDPINMSFMGASVTLYTAETDGTSVWSGKVDILIEDGLTSFTLPVDENVFGTNKDLWVEIKLTDDLKVARRRITSVPYAFYADQAGSCAALNGEPSTYYQNADNINTGTLSHERYDVYGNLSAAGHLDNNADSDLLTRTQSDERFLNSSGDSMTGNLTVDGQLRGGTLRLGEATSSKMHAFLWTDIAPNTTSCDTQCAQGSSGRGGVCLVAYDGGIQYNASQYDCDTTIDDNKLCVCVGKPTVAF